MKRFLSICALILTSLLAATGCSQGGAAAPTPAANTAAATETPAEKTVLYGKVTAVDGNTITLALGNMGGIPGGPDMQNQSGNPQGAPSGTQDAKPEGTPPSQGDGNQNGNAPQGTPPSGGSGDQSGDQQGQPPSGGSGGPGAGSLTLTGESKAITLTGDTKIVKYANGRQADAAVSDIAVDDILAVTLNGDAAEAVDIGLGGMTGADGPSTADAGTGAYNA